MRWTEIADQGHIRPFPLRLYTHSETEGGSDVTHTLTARAGFAVTFLRGKQSRRSYSTSTGTDCILYAVCLLRK